MTNLAQAASRIAQAQPPIFGILRKARQSCIALPRAPRAGWQPIGCFHATATPRIAFEVGDGYQGVGEGLAALQVFARPPTSDEQARLGILIERDHRRMEWCDECAPFMLSCPQIDFHCPAFARCLEKKGDPNPHKCDGSPFPVPVDWTPRL